MHKDCPKCGRAAEIIERDGFTHVFGVGIEHRGKELHLKPSEHKILRLLLKRPFVPIDVLIAEICRPGTADPKGSIKVQMSCLRGALKIVGAPFEIENRFGQGYELRNLRP